MQYCSYSIRFYFSPQTTSTTRYCSCFGSAPSFLLELFLCSFPVVHWAPTDLESSSFSVISFCLFMVFMGFSRQERGSGLPFPSPMDHILSELSTMTHLCRVALYGMAHSFIELDKQNLVHTRTKGKGQWPPRETEPDLPLSVWVSLAEAWVSSDLPLGRGLWLQQTWEAWCVACPLGGGCD